MIDLVVWLLIFAGIYYSWMKKLPLGDLLFAIAMGIACIDSFMHGHNGWGILQGILAVLCYRQFDDKTKNIDG